MLPLIVCIATTILLTWAAANPSNDLQIGIFDFEHGPKKFELDVVHVISAVRAFYAKHKVLSVDSQVREYMPDIGEMKNIVQQLYDTLEQSQWRDLYEETISNDTYADADIRSIKPKMDTLKSIQTRIEKFKSNPTAITAFDLHLDLAQLINLFDSKTSTMRKYPLLGASPFIQLASLIAIFIPFAKALMPVDLINVQLSCKFRDILLDYRRHTLNGRFHKIYANTSDQSHVSIFDEKLHEMSIPYNDDEYNQNGSDELECERRCEGAKDKKSNKFCLKDLFGSIEYQVNINETKCVKDYLALIRRRVDKLFPIDLMKKNCDDSLMTKKPTGEFKIQFKLVSNLKENFLNFN